MEIHLKTAFKLGNLESCFKATLKLGELHTAVTERFPCYSFPLREVLYIPAISWLMRKLLANLQNAPSVVVRTAFQSATKSVNANNWIYTDGSQYDGATGAAIYVNENTTSLCKLHEPATVFDAELTAIEMAITYIGSQDTDSYAIASDSMSALSALENNAISAKASMLLYQCRSKLQRLSHLGFTVTLVWVPAHRGIYGNSRADELAKTATNDGTPLSHRCPEWQSHVAPLRKLLVADWQRGWNSCELGRFCHSVIPKVSLAAWFNRFDGPLGRVEIRTACRIVANHYTLNNHLNRFSITDSPLCTCGAYQTVDHVLFECPTSLIGRRTLTQHLYQDGYTDPLVTRDILATTTKASTIARISQMLVENEIKL